jgi:hypothetical protein
LPALKLPDDRFRRSSRSDHAQDYTPLVHEASFDARIIS